jgi:hypothetical protein
MLAEEAEYWMENTCHRIEAAGTVITREGFKNEFMGKYFPADVCSTKEWGRGLYPSQMFQVW